MDIGVCTLQHCLDSVKTYPGDAFRKRIEPLAERVNSNIVLPCDVSQDGEVERMFQNLKGHSCPAIDFVELGDN